MKLFAFFMLLLSAAFLAVSVLATTGHINLTNEDFSPLLVIFGALMVAYVHLSRNKLGRSKRSRHGRRRSSSLTSMLGIQRLW